MDYDSICLSALADPTRRAILDQLSSSPKTVRQLTDVLPVSQPAISQHLRKLGAAKLVTCTPKGASNIYHLDPTGLESIRSVLDRYWATALANFKTVAEENRAQ